MLARPGQRREPFEYRQHELGGGVLDRDDAYAFERAQPTKKLRWTEAAELRQEDDLDAAAGDPLDALAKGPGEARPAENEGAHDTSSVAQAHKLVFGDLRAARSRP